MTKHTAAYYRAYRARNRDRIRKQQREYRAKNLERLREYQRGYYGRRRADGDYREREAEQARAWRSSAAGKRCAAEYRKTDAYRRSQLKDRLKRHMGITVERYEEMLREQDGRCGLCGTSPRSRRRLAVDHCHRTKRVRGLLCDNCNLWLGHVERYLHQPAAIDQWLRR